MQFNIEYLFLRQLADFLDILKQRMPRSDLDYHIKCNTAPKKERHCVRFVLE